MKIPSSRAVKLAVCALGALTLSACTTSGLEAVGKPGDPKYAKHLIIHNEPLADTITITDMDNRSVGGLLEARVELSNLSGSDVNIQYKFTWFDADNFEVDPGADAWTPLSLHGHASASIKAVAPNPTVTSYKVNVREL